MKNSFLQPPRIFMQGCFFNSGIMKVNVRFLVRLMIAIAAGCFSAGIVYGIYLSCNPQDTLEFVIGLGLVFINIQNLDHSFKQWKYLDTL